MRTWIIKFVRRDGEEFVSKFFGEREDALKVIEKLLIEFQKDLLEGRIIAVM